MHIPTLALLCLGSCVAQAECRVEAARLLPVLELYTSEGCSSCPPADRWMSKLAADPIDAVPLAFHVDYWDELGWKDRFASHDHTLRQNRRVQAAGDRTVYTPQAMLGENVQLKWNLRSMVSAAAKRQVLAPPGLQASLAARRSGEGWQARFDATGLPEGEWQIEYAAYRDGETSVVKAGENRDVTLHHDRVVVGMHGPGALASSWNSAPAGASGLVAIVSRAGEAGTGWALDLPLRTCAAESDG